MKPHILLIDNYDSFSHNLVHALGSAGAHVGVRRNDQIRRDDIEALGIDGIVLSPGPGHPAVPRDFGVCADLILDPMPADPPILGVCLGMQGMAHHTGGTVTAAPDVVHGRATLVDLADDPLFAGVPRPCAVGRYHSLMVDPATLPPQWEPLGSTPDGILMAMRHQSHPWYGVQFHPESILTPDGPVIIENFVRRCARGVRVAA